MERQIEALRVFVFATDSLTGGEAYLAGPDWATRPQRWYVEMSMMNVCMYT